LLPPNRNNAKIENKEIPMNIQRSKKMRIISKKPFLLFLCVFLVAGMINPVDAQENVIRAKIGLQIRSGDRIIRAKSKDRLKAADLIRIYVHPEENSHIYVVHSDIKESALLNIVQKKIQSSLLVMPSSQGFYQVDGNSPNEVFTIIVSPDELPEVSDLLGTGNIPYPKWVEVEKMLIEKGRIGLTQDVEKPFPIAGNVRGLSGVGDIDPFVSKLQIFSGKSILVKKYEFEVKK
jgi:hypothetical protein